MIEVSLFRVPTFEILDELAFRASSHQKSTFVGFSSKELLEYILKNRMDSFKD